MCVDILPPLTITITITLTLTRQLSSEITHPQIPWQIWQVFKKEQGEMDKRGENSVAKHWSIGVVNTLAVVAQVRCR